MSIFDFLTHPKPPVIPAGASAERDRALHALIIGEQYCIAGTKEEGGNNLGDQVTFFQKMTSGSPGDPWCLDFFFTCEAKAWMWKRGLLTGKTGHENRLIILSQVDAFCKESGFPRSGSCLTFWQTMDHLGKAVGKHNLAMFTPSPGDAVLFDFKSQGEPHHIGRVVKVMQNGEFYTCEGNTPGGIYGAQNDGDGCYMRLRDRAAVFGFVHWK